MKCLVVEDEFINRRVLQLFLEKYGKCDVATNGKIAVKLYENSIKEHNPYDLICLDMVMPEMDGNETLKVIRQMEKKEGLLEDESVNIIITSSLNDKASILNAYKNQCSGYIVKPVKKNELLTKLEDLELI